MKTDVKNFPFGASLKDLMYLIYQSLQSIVGVLSPAGPLYVTDITKLSNSQLDGLNVGDAVVKVTGVQKHLYLVSYKGDGAGQGICLSYNAAGYGETVSYDRSGEGWVYNSTDVKTYGE